MRLTTEPTKLALHLIDVPQSRKQWRPSSRCSPESLAPLVQQIKAVGWVDAIIVRPTGDRYELLDGERRLVAEAAAGSQMIDAIIVHADEGTTSTISLLANLPGEEIPPIHLARLIEWLRGLNKSEGGKGTNSEVAAYLGRDASTVSRARTIGQGLPKGILQTAGLVDDDLEEVPSTQLQRLAMLPPRERATTLQEVAAAKAGGADRTVIKTCIAKCVSANKRPGRPPKAFSVTDRADGRFDCSIRKRDMDQADAHELLAALRPILLSLSSQARIESLDEFVGLASPRVLPLEEQPRASCRKERNLKRFSEMRGQFAVKLHVGMMQIRSLTCSVMRFFRRRE